MIPFGPWMPDQPVTMASQNILNAHCRRAAGGGVTYAPAASLQAVTGADALPEAPQGAFYGVQSSGAYTVFVCTSDTIYTVSASGALSAIGTGYALPSGDIWAGVQFGKYMLFSNTVDGMLAYDIDAGGSISAVSGAPSARQLFVWANCVFALDCDGDNRVMQNSNFNDHTNWSTGAADYQKFEEGGALMWGGALDERGAIVLQQTQVRILSAEGTGLVYSVRSPAGRVGCVNPSAGSTINGMAFFVDTSGFWVYRNGLLAIGDGKVSQTFINTMISAEGFDSLSVTADPQNKRFMVRYQSQDVASTTVFEDAIAYYWDVNEFVLFTESTSAMVTLATPAIDLEDISDDIEDVELDIDDPYWSGGKPRLAAFDENYKLAYFTGASLAATFETADVSAESSQRVTRISVDADVPAQTTGVTMQLGTRQSRGASINWSTATQVQPSGRAPVRGRGKIVRARLNIAAGASWTEATGVEFPKAFSGGPR